VRKRVLDYRNKFIGKYDFTIVHSYATYDYSSDRITGGSKTLFYAGSVQKSFFHINRINVDWGSGTVPTEDGQEVQRDKTPLQVDEDGNLEYPEISEGFYEPHYNHGDTIFLDLMPARVWHKAYIPNIQSGY
jgi:hypothetical protein